MEKPSSDFINAYGHSQYINYRPVRELQRPSSGEGGVDLVETRLGNARRTFIVKTPDQELIPSTPQMAPREQLEKWRVFNNAGMTVTPTFRISVDGRLILATDLTGDGRYEVVDPIIHLMDQRQEPEWYDRHRTSIFNGVIKNALIGDILGYYVGGDGYMFVHDSTKDKTAVCVADLGRGINKPAGNRPAGVGNVELAFDMLKKAKLCTSEERDHIVYRYGSAS